LGNHEGKAKQRMICSQEKTTKRLNQKRTESEENAARLPEKRTVGQKGLRTHKLFEEKGPKSTKRP